MCCALAFELLPMERCISSCECVSFPALWKRGYGDPRPGLLCVGDRTCSCGNDVVICGELCSTACCTVVPPEPLAAWLAVASQFLDALANTE